MQFTSTSYYICTGSGATFSASSPGASQYVWTTTGGLLINGQPSPYTSSSASVTISPPNQYATGNAQVSVKAVSGSCGESSPATQNVWMNTPSQPSVNVTGNPATINLSLGGWTQVYTTATPGAVSGQVFWQVANRMSPGTPVTGLAIYQTQGNVTSIEALEAGYYYLMVRAWNNCGYSMYRYIDVNVSVGGGGGGPAYTIETSPNPAKEYIDVKVKKVKEDKSKMKEVRLVLYDGQGSIVQEVVTSEDSKRLDVRKQREGLYYLHLYYEGGVEKKQVLIRR